MKKLALAFAFLIGSIASAFAACTPPAVMHDFPGTAFNMSMATAADGNCASSITLQSGGVASGAVASGAYSSGAFASGAYASGSIGSGAMVDLGAIADAAATTGSTGSLSAKMRLMTTQLNTLNTTLGTPFQAGGSIGNTTFAVTQATSSNLKAQVDPLTAASWGIGTSTQNSATVANGVLALAQFNTTPTTITTTNMSPLQMDNAGNLLVNIKAGAGSGGTAIADNAAFTQGTTSETPAGCLYNTAYANATTGHSTIPRCTITGDIFTNIDSYAGTALTGTVTAYGTAPTGNVFGVNAFVTNTNVNGQATAANSSPVVLPAAQVTADPCTLGTKTNFAIATSSGTLQLVAPSGSTQVYVCSFSLIGAATAVVNLVGGTGATCTTGTPVAALGSTTAASGASLAANGGLTFGNGGATVARTTTAGHGLCLIQSGTTALAGNITYVQQ